MNTCGMPVVNVVFDHVRGRAESWSVHAVKDGWRWYASINGNKQFGVSTSPFAAELAAKVALGRLRGETP